ncbi:MAG TPA: metalloregulator ArsR/SmtB family transcription factor [Patescibacteria group bacterium]|nr:metalloregulator ArsR/SmtB family transcription factor [bacterium]HRT11298.1 metalloregulator ArsR/SmtB family transcription factor [Patescibacteria group bacterium]HRU89776.1 metalloregulator ArsR/SmtB family transcription factor [Patescibacteria group bacterium]
MYFNEALGALADPTRRKILKLLSRRNLSAGEIGRHFDITAPSLSHHLSVLLMAGLVNQSRQGRSLIYSLKPGAIEMVANKILAIVRESNK